MRIIVEDISKNFNIGLIKGQSLLARAASLVSGKDPLQTIEALKNISFSVGAGEVLGIIGSNGAGKSTLLRIIAGIYKPDKGKVSTEGKIFSMINLVSGLCERLTMKENIYLLGSFAGFGRKKINEAFCDIVDFSGLDKFVNTKIYQFSEGMKQRLAFSVIIHSRPDILLLDEVFETGDADFRQKSAGKVNEMIKKGGSAVLASHDLNAVKRYCSKTLWINKGEIVSIGKSEDVIGQYSRHIWS